MKESFKQKMQENKPPLTFKNTKKNICLEKNGNFFWRWPLGNSDDNNNNYNNNVDKHSAIHTPKAKK